MTFITFSQPVDVFSDAVYLMASVRKTIPPSARRRFADEDGARRALGTDGQVHVAAAPGTSLENLARIAFG